MPENLALVGSKGEEVAAVVTKGEALTRGGGWVSHVRKRHRSDQ